MVIQLESTGYMQVKVKAKRKRDIIPEREEDSKVARGGITYIFSQV